jgi:hypothetical protein
MDRQRERKRGTKYSRRVGENENSWKKCETFYCGWGEHPFVEGSQASPSCPDKSSTKVETLE